MRHSETRVAFVRRRHFRCWGGPWVTEFHWAGSASKRGLWVGTCIFGFSWVGTPVFSHFQCRQARPEGFFGSAPGRRRTEWLAVKICCLFLEYFFGNFSTMFIFILFDDMILIFYCAVEK